MRRVFLAALGLFAGVTLLLSLKIAPGATPQRAAPGAASSAPPTDGPEPSPDPSTSPSDSPSPSSTTYTGDSAYTEFGYVTVQITVSNGQITDITAVEMPADEARSVALSARVEPILRERALTAQSVDFDTASGATWTSEAYRESLQSALVKAGLA